MQKITEAELWELVDFLKVHEDKFIAHNGGEVWLNDDVLFSVLEDFFEVEYLDFNE